MQAKLRWFWKTVPKQNVRGYSIFSRHESMRASDPLEVFVAEFVEEDVGSNDVHEHLHMHAVPRDVAALRGTQHTSGVPVRQLLRTEPLMHVPIGLPRITRQNYRIVVSYIAMTFLKNIGLPLPPCHPADPFCRPSQNFG